MISGSLPKLDGAIEIKHLSPELKKKLEKIADKNKPLTEKDAEEIKKEILRDGVIDKYEVDLLKEMTSDKNKAVFLKKSDFQPQEVEFKPGKKDKKIDSSKIEAKAKESFSEMLNGIEENKKYDLKVEGKFNDPETRKKFMVTQGPSQFNRGAKSWVNSNCGPSSTLMCLKAFGIKKFSGAKAQEEMQGLRARRNIPGPFSLNEIKRAVEDESKKSKVKLKAEVFRHTDPSLDTPEKFLEKMKQELEAGKFVILLAGNLNKGKGAHYMVVTGIKDGKIQVADPGVAKGVTEYDIEAFKASFNTRHAQKKGEGVGMVSVSPKS